MAESTIISNTANLEKYLKLEQKGKVIAEYVWIDGSNGVRSKSKTLDKKVTSLDDLPEWNFDGSSTGQAPGDNSDVYLAPAPTTQTPSAWVTTSSSFARHGCLMASPTHTTSATMPLF
jgi:glutamine synthetase